MSILATWRYSINPKLKAIAHTVAVMRIHLLMDFGFFSITKATPRASARPPEAECNASRMIPRVVNVYRAGMAPTSDGIITRIMGAAFNTTIMAVISLCLLRPCAVFSLPNLIPIIRRIRIAISTIRLMFAVSGAAITSILDFRI